MSQKNIRRTYGKEKNGGYKNNKKLARNRKVNHDYLHLIAAKYYAQIFPRFKGKKGWQKVKCIFHEDHNPSLSISMDHGGFKCFSCGASGDLVKFHMLKQQKNFVDTVTELNAWEA